MRYDIFLRSIELGGKVSHRQNYVAVRFYLHDITIINSYL